jgi:mRNA interferase HigB
MHVISRKKLLEFSIVHPDAEKPLDVWYRGSKSAKWNNFADVKLIYSSADRRRGQGSEVGGQGIRAKFLTP